MKLPVLRFPTNLCPMNYFIYDGQNGTWSSKSNEFQYNFLIICRYFYLAKKSEDNLIVNGKFTSCKNTKILKRSWKNIYI